MRFGRFGAALAAFGMGWCVAGAAWAEAAEAALDLCLKGDGRDAAFVAAANAAGWKPGSPDLIPEQMRSSELKTTVFVEGAPRDPSNPTFVFLQTGAPEPNHTVEAAICTSFSVRAPSDLERRVTAKLGFEGLSDQGGHIWVSVIENGRRRAAPELYSDQAASQAIQNKSPVVVVMLFHNADVSMTMVAHTRPIAR